jgi:hypothetical protein
LTPTDRDASRREFLRGGLGAMDSAERFGDDLLRVPKLGVADALKKYGNASHHG